MNITDKYITDITKITNIIKTEYPELLQFFNESPETIPNQSHPKISNSALKEYYSSLYSLLEDYKPNHPYIVERHIMSK